MNCKKSLVVTSIADDKHPVLNLISDACAKRKIDFILIGDSKSPDEFSLQGCDFWSIKRQKEMFFKLSQIIPEKHYSRKNLGYLLAIKNGSDCILETDDDNIPREDFWNDFPLELKCRSFENTGWTNVYRFFTKTTIWPRGFPLEKILNDVPKEIYIRNNICPIKQGLADENPDVDAIYRLTYPLPVNFEIKNEIALGKKSWCPFNSQNTYWHKNAFPLLYLPSYCSFRMTDIWRSFIAQRISWECGWSILFFNPTVLQKRNEHNLMNDFKDEVSGYYNNLAICSALEKLKLKPGPSNIFSNMQICYNLLIEMGVVKKEEMDLLNAWINDIRSI